MALRLSEWLGVTLGGREKLVVDVLRIALVEIFDGTAANEPCFFEQLLRRYIAGVCGREQFSGIAVAFGIPKKRQSKAAASVVWDHGHKWNECIAEERVVNDYEPTHLTPLFSNVNVVGVQPRFKGFAAFW